MRIYDIIYCFGRRKKTTISLLFKRSKKFLKINLIENKKNNNYERIR